MNQNTTFFLRATQNKMIDLSSDLENLLIALRAIETDDPQSQAIQIAVDIALNGNAETVSDLAYRMTNLLEKYEAENNYYE